MRLLFGLQIVQEWSILEEWRQQQPDDYGTRVQGAFGIVGEAGCD